FGGAFGPVTALPDWMQAVAPASPAYWALEAITAVSLEGAGLSAVIGPGAVLLGFAGTFLGAAVLGFQRRRRRPGCHRDRQGSPARTSSPQLWSSSTRAAWTGGPCGRWAPRGGSTRWRSIGCSPAGARSPRRLRSSSGRAGTSRRGTRQAPGRTTRSR